MRVRRKEGGGIVQHEGSLTNRYRTQLHQLNPSNTILICGYESMQQPQTLKYKVQCTPSKNFSNLVCHKDQRIFIHVVPICLPDICVIDSFVESSETVRSNSTIVDCGNVTVNWIRVGKCSQPLSSACHMSFWI